MLGVNRQPLDVIITDLGKERKRAHNRLAQRKCCSRKRRTCRPSISPASDGCSITSGSSSVYPSSMSSDRDCMTSKILYLIAQETTEDALESAGIGAMTRIDDGLYPFDLHLPVGYVESPFPFGDQLIPWSNPLPSADRSDIPVEPIYSEEAACDLLSLADTIALPMSSVSRADAGCTTTSTPQKGQFYSNALGGLKHSIPPHTLAWQSQVDGPVASFDAGTPSQSLSRDREPNVLSGRLWQLVAYSRNLGFESFEDVIKAYYEMNLGGCVAVDCSQMPSVALQSQRTPAAL